MTRTHPLSDLRLCEPKRHSMLDDKASDFLVWRQPHLLLAVGRTAASTATARVCDTSTSWVLATSHGKAYFTKIDKSVKS